jgi:glycosyltransferase involved in cell wall biosynthesis
MLAESLCATGYTVDILTFHEGEDIAVTGLTIIRIQSPLFVNNVPIGFSWKKLVCDVFLSWKLIQIMRQNDYRVVHAFEEAIFPALVVNYFARKLLVYDMDSSMADQLMEKWPILQSIKSILYGLERLAVRKSSVVFAVCRDLVERARLHDRSKRIYLLEDVALPMQAGGIAAENLRRALGCQGCLALYVGNLEHYQGIDLMLQSVAAVDRTIDLTLAVIGGSRGDICRFQAMSQKLGIQHRVHFLGPRPIANLRQLLVQGDILVSPRLKGQNTPMKIYSYLAAGKPVLATNIRSHTQVLNPSFALLVKPMVGDMARGLAQLARDSELRHTLGARAYKVAHDRYSPSAFRGKAQDAYSELIGMATR